MTNYFKNKNNVMVICSAVKYLDKTSRCSGDKSIFVFPMFLFLFVNAINHYHDYTNYFRDRFV